VLVVFFIEIMLLLLGYGLRFFKKWLYVMDLLIIVSSIIVDVRSSHFDHSPLWWP